MRKRRRNLSFLLYFFVGISLFVSCGQGGTGGSTAGNAQKDTSTARTIIQYSQGLRIDYYDHYKLVRILNRQGQRTDTLSYVLVRQGFPAPADHPGIPVITVPVKSMAVLSSMHIGLAEFAGVADRIVGIGNAQYLNSTQIIAATKTGKVTEIGLDGNLNEERIISMHPGALLTMSNPDASFGKYKTLGDAGVPVMPVADWLESTPLGRAEWVKLIAALTDREEYVNKKFDSVVRSYNELAQKGRQVKTRPRVIIGLPFKGTWFVPAGESYMAQFLRDAGADYKWSDTKGKGGLGLNFEAVAPEALAADYWLNIGYVDSKKDVIARDTRYTSFRSVQTGALYNYNKRAIPSGGNDYWESGPVNPQLVLADLIRILHPDLLPKDTLVYYKQLP